MIETQSPGDKINISLYVLSNSAQSIRAIKTVNSICQNELKGQCKLQIIDIQEMPEAAEKYAIIAAPTLIKFLPLPLRRILGDFTNSKELLLALQLPPEIWQEE
jgi:circadian clock protein KaiB